MTADENKNEELKEDSQPDKNTQDDKVKVAEKKGLGRRNTILLYLPVIIMVSTFLLVLLYVPLSISYHVSSLADGLLSFVILFIIASYIVSLPVSWYVLFAKVIRYRNYWLAVKCILLSWLLIGILVCILALPSFMNARRSAFENRGKLILRALRAAQTTFAERNNGNYGTWQEMVDQDYIEGSYTRENIIDEYVITTFMVDNPSESERVSGKTSSFTITAIPKTTKNKLRTFAIGVDQTPRVYVGDADAWSTVNVSLNNIELWEPLR